MNNRKKIKGFFVSSIFLLVVVLLAGCARNRPATLPVSRDKQVHAEKILKILQQRKRIDYFDADITIIWSGYGTKSTFSGTLQATDIGRFRLSGLDPLGRPFFLLTADNQSFTFIDNRRGRGYTGSANSAFVQKYIPVDVPFSVLYSMLTGQLPHTATMDVDIRESKTGKSYWFVFSGSGGTNFLAEADEVSGRLLRQIVMDQDEKVVLDIHYEEFQTESGLFFFPSRLRIKGDELPGTVELIFEKIYLRNMLPDSVFTLRIPEYFDIIHVQ